MRSIIRFIALSVTVVLPFLWAAPVEAGPPYVFDLRLTETCQYGTGPASHGVNVLLASASGHQLDKQSDVADGSGNWGVCFNTPLAPGMKVTAKHAGVHRSVIVPTLSISADRVTNVVSGSAPLGSSTSIAAMSCTMLGACTEHDYAVVANSSGHYRIDLGSQAPAWDVRGGDYLDLQNHGSDGDLFEVPIQAPYMIVDYPSLVQVQGVQPGTSVTVRLKTAGGTVRATRTKVITTVYANQFKLRSNGNDVKIKPGNTISSTIATDAHFSWDVALTASTAHGTVSGHCFDNAELRAGVNHDGNGQAQFGTTAADGTFSFDFSGFGLTAGDALDLECINAKGDELTYTSSVP